MSTPDEHSSDAAPISTASVSTQYPLSGSPLHTSPTTSMTQKLATETHLDDNDKIGLHAMKF